MSEGRKVSKEERRQAIGGVVNESERGQCGYCGDWYDVPSTGDMGVCRAHAWAHVHNTLTSEGY